MLKITTADDAPGVTLRMEGQLAGSRVRELAVTWNAAVPCLAEKPMQVDRTAEAHIDARTSQC